MIGTFMMNDVHEVCLTLFNNADKVKQLRLVDGNICMILDENDNEEMITEEIHETIHTPLSQQQNILIVHMSNEAMSIEEYKVPITN
jgi:hypothetical protein